MANLVINPNNCKYKVSRAVSNRRDVSNSIRFEIAPRLLDVIVDRNWSPIIWEYGRRKEANFFSCSWLALDFDGGMKLRDAQTLFEQYRYVIAPTKSHSPELHRFRLVIPLNSVVKTVAHYRQLMTGVVKDFGADSACVDGARFFYPSKSIYDVKREGAFYPVPPIAFVSPKKYQYTGTKQIPLWMEKELSHGFGPGSRNRTIFRFSCHLGEAGFDRESIKQIIEGGNWEKEGFSQAELQRTIQSALEKCRGNHGEGTERLSSTL